LDRVVRRGVQEGRPLQSMSARRSAIERISIPISKALVAADGFGGRSGTASRFEMLASAAHVIT
jgi:hypothetical protein